MGKLNDLTGKKFGRLTVIERDGSNVHNKALWKCQCDCGKCVTVIGSHLLNGNTNSCGCYKSDKTSKRNSTHHKSGTRLYTIWKNMRQRCNNSNVPCYVYYGGKGIKIAPEWNDFNSFEQWAKANDYSDTLSIDRIDVNGDYCPTNCRWVSMREQNRNMSKNRVIEFNGEKHCITEWAEVVGVSSKALGNRINAYAWSVEDALTLPTNERRCRR